jgi:hypothetical protein
MEEDFGPHVLLDYSIDQQHGLHGFGTETDIPGQLVVSTAGEGEDEHVVRVFRKTRTGRPRGGGERQPSAINTSPGTTWHPCITRCCFLLWDPIQDILQTAHLSPPIQWYTYQAKDLSFGQSCYQFWILQIAQDKSCAVFLAEKKIKTYVKRKNCSLEMQ